MIAIPVQSKVYGEKLFFIDGEDLEKVDKYKWFAAYDKTIDNYYIMSSTKKPKRLRLHRFIMDCPEGMVVDHIDGNTLNNCKSNLRICTMKENAKNKKPYKNKTHSKYKGVHKSGNKFELQMNINGKYKYIGTYKTEEEAALKYNELAKEHYGQFARLNII